MTKRFIAALKYQLKDPDSAQIRNVKFTRHRQSETGNVFVMICGEVNARNGYGGYGGFERFTVSKLESSKDEPGVFLASDEIGIFAVEAAVKNGLCQ